MGAAIAVVEGCSCGCGCYVSVWLVAEQKGCRAGDSLAGKREAVRCDAASNLACLTLTREGGEPGGGWG